MKPHPHSKKAQSLSGQSAEDLPGHLPGVKTAGISALAALTEVSHPAVVSEAADSDDMGALTTLGTLVDFVMFVESRARFATLIKMSESRRSG